VPYPLDTAPSQRFRIEQWREWLRTDGIRVDIVPFADPRLMTLLYRSGRPMTKAIAVALAFARRLAMVRSIHNYDAVAVHRSACLVGPAVLERLLARRQRLIFDFDDAIFVTHTTSANRAFGWLKFAGKTAAVCRASAHIVAGNDYLGAYARRYNARVTVIPSSVDTDRYRPRLTEKTSVLVVGWMGTSTSQTYLESFVPVLREFSARTSVEIRVISDRSPSLPGVPFVWREWCAATELEELRAFDIGIMPMPDDRWAHGKCAMKALLYMSVGVPVICSSVGVNRDIIRHGENGFLAASPEEWRAALDALLSDPALRRRVGQAGRATVESTYSARRCASLFAEVVRKTVVETP
jgi:glycosyltransferase involved in cell wall biosynthesis